MRRGIHPRLIEKRYEGTDVLLMRSGMQRFEPDGSGGWIHENFHDTSAYTLSGDWDNGFTLTAKDGSVDLFNTSGQITSTIDPAGNETNVRVDYAVGKGTILEGLVATFRYSWLHQDGSPQTQTQLRAYLNYAFRF